MSRVISFRLDDDNPDEATAAQVLDWLVASGLTARQAIVRALLKAGDVLPAQDDTPAELRAALDEARALTRELTAALAQVKQTAPAVAQPAAQDTDERPVSPTFRASIRRAAKGGLKLE